MTDFETFVTTWCDRLSEPTGDHACVVADIYLRKVERVSDPVTQRAVVDYEMRGTLYFDEGYAGFVPCEFDRTPVDNHHVTIKTEAPMWSLCLLLEQTNEPQILDQNQPSSDSTDTARL